MVKAGAFDGKSGSGDKDKASGTATKFKKKGVVNTAVEEEDDDEETEVKDNELSIREHLLRMLGMSNTLVGNANNVEELATKSKGYWDGNTLSNPGVVNIQVGGTDRDADNENLDQGVFFVTKVQKV